MSPSPTGLHLFSVHPELVSFRPGVLSNLTRPLSHGFLSLLPSTSAGTPGSISSSLALRSVSAPAVNSVHGQTRGASDWLSSFFIPAHCSFRTRGPCKGHVFGIKQLITGYTFSTFWVWDRWLHWRRGELCAADFLRLGLSGEMFINSLGFVFVFREIWLLSVCVCVCWQLWFLWSSCCPSPMWKELTAWFKWHCLHCLCRRSLIIQPHPSLVSCN